LVEEKKEIRKQSNGALRKEGDKREITFYLKNTCEI
jgi:hypothetical protein